MPARADSRSHGWILSAVVHALLLLAVLSFLRVPAPATPQEASVAMVFQPPAAPAPAPAPPEPPEPPAAQPDQAPLAASVPPPEPAPPPPAPAPTPAPPPTPAQEAAPTPSPPTVFARAPKPQPRHAATPPRPTSPPATAPPAAAPPAASGPPTPAAGPAPAEPRAAPIDGSWMQSLGSWLAAHKTYPEDARSLGEEGRLAVRFTVDRAGRVTGVEIVRSSGSPRLDDAARRMLQGATLPSLPATMTQDSVTVTVQIRYALAP